MSNISISEVKNSCLAIQESQPVSLNEWSEVQFDNDCRSVILVLVVYGTSTILMLRCTLSWMCSQSMAFIKTWTTIWCSNCCQNTCRSGREFHQHVLMTWHLKDNTSDLLAFWHKEKSGRKLKQTWVVSIQVIYILSMCIPVIHIEAFSYLDFTV